MQYPYYQQPSESSGTAFDQDGSQGVSSAMERSSSSSTTMTYDSGRTQGTYETTLSSLGSPIVEGEVWSPTLAYHSWDLDHPQDPNELLVGSGAQYPPSQYPSTMQPFDGDFCYNDSWAMTSPTTQGYGSNSGDSFASLSNTIGGDGPLYGSHYNPHDQRQQWSGLDASSMVVQTTSSKQTFLCLVSGCKQKGFSRSADLDRHYKMVHVDEDSKVKFNCDYRKCSRHESPFYRQDHFRDHLREFHKEDLLRRSKKPDGEFWLTRNSKAVYNGWWRCNKCLVVRVHIATNGFVCPKCENPCEPERRRVREATGRR